MSKGESNVVYKFNVVYRVNHALDDSMWCGVVTLKT